MRGHYDLVRFGGDSIGVNGAQYRSMEVNWGSVGPSEGYSGSVGFTGKSVGLTGAKRRSLELSGFH